MFFFLSKTIGPWLLPSNFLIAIGAFGVVLVYTRHKLLGRRLLIVCVVGLVICGFSPLGNALLMPIEARFSKWKARPEHQIDGIIVLGGGIERIGAAVELAREHPNARVLYTGGEPDLFRSDELAETDIALRFFDEFGISRQRLLLERRARNTGERRVLKSNCRSQARRALAADNLCLAYAESNGRVSNGRVSGGSLSGGSEDEGMVRFARTAAHIFGWDCAHGCWRA